MAHRGRGSTLSNELQLSVRHLPDHEHSSAPPVPSTTHRCRFTVTEVAAYLFLLVVAIDLVIWGSAAVASPGTAASGRYVFPAEDRDIDTHVDSDSVYTSFTVACTFMIVISAASYHVSRIVANPAALVFARAVVCATAGAVVGVLLIANIGVFAVATHIGALGSADPDWFTDSQGEAHRWIRVPVPILAFAAVAPLLNVINKNHLEALRGRAITVVTTNPGYMFLMFTFFALLNLVPRLLPDVPYIYLLFVFEALTCIPKMVFALNNGGDYNRLPGHHRSWPWFFTAVHAFWIFVQLGNAATNALYIAGTCTATVNELFIVARIIVGFLSDVIYVQFASSYAQLETHALHAELQTQKGELLVREQRAEAARDVASALWDYQANMLLNPVHGLHGTAELLLEEVDALVDEVHRASATGHASPTASSTVAAAAIAFRSPAPLTESSLTTLRDGLRDIVSASNRIARLVWDCRDISLLQRGALRVHVRLVPLTSIVDALRLAYERVVNVAEDVMTPRTRHPQRASFAWIVNDDVPTSLATDATRLDQILTIGLSQCLEQQESAMHGGVMLHVSGVSHAADESTPPTLCIRLYTFSVGQLVRDERLDSRSRGGGGGVSSVGELGDGGEERGGLYYGRADAVGAALAYSCYSHGAAATKAAAAAPCSAHDAPAPQSSIPLDYWSSSSADGAPAPRTPTHSTTGGVDRRGGISPSASAVAATGMCGIDVYQRRLSEGRLRPDVLLNGRVSGTQTRTTRLQQDNITQGGGSESQRQHDSSRFQGWRASETLPFHDSTLQTDSRVQSGRGGPFRISQLWHRQSSGSSSVNDSADATDDTSPRPFVLSSLPFGGHASTSFPVGAVDLKNLVISTSTSPVGDAVNTPNAACGPTYIAPGLLSERAILISRLQALGATVSSASSLLSPGVVVSNGDLVSATAPHSTLSSAATPGAVTTSYAVEQQQRSGATALVVHPAAVTMIESVSQPAAVTCAGTSLSGSTSMQPTKFATAPAVLAIEYAPAASRVEPVRSIGVVITASFPRLGLWDRNHQRPPPISLPPPPPPPPPHQRKAGANVPRPGDTFNDRGEHSPQTVPPQGLSQGLGVPFATLLTERLGGVLRTYHVSSGDSEYAWALETMASLQQRVASNVITRPRGAVATAADADAAVTAAAAADSSGQHTDDAAGLHWPPVNVSTRTVSVAQNAVDAARAASMHTQTSPTHLAAMHHHRSLQVGLQGMPEWRSNGSTSGAAASQSGGVRALLSLSSAVSKNAALSPSSSADRGASPLAPPFPIPAAAFDDGVMTHECLSVFEVSLPLSSRENSGSTVYCEPPADDSVNVVTPLIVAANDGSIGAGVALRRGGDSSAVSPLRPLSLSNQTPAASKTVAELHSGDLMGATGSSHSSLRPHLTLPPGTVTTSASYSDPQALLADSQFSTTAVARLSRGQRVDTSFRDTTTATASGPNTILTRTTAATATAAYVAHTILTARSPSLSPGTVMPRPTADAAAAGAVSTAGTVAPSAAAARVIGGEELSPSDRVHGGVDTSFSNRGGNGCAHVHGSQLCGRGAQGYEGGVLPMSAHTSDTPAAAAAAAAASDHVAILLPPLVHQPPPLDTHSRRLSIVVHPPAEVLMLLHPAVSSSARTSTGHVSTDAAIVSGGLARSSFAPSEGGSTDGTQSRYFTEQSQRSQETRITEQSQRSQETRTEPSRDTAATSPWGLSPFRTSTGTTTAATVTQSSAISPERDLTGASETLSSAMSPDTGSSSSSNSSILPGCAHVINDVAVAASAPIAVLPTCTQGSSSSNSGGSSINSASSDGLPNVPFPRRLASQTTQSVSSTHSSHVPSSAHSTHAPFAALDSPLSYIYRGSSSSSVNGLRGLSQESPVLQQQYLRSHSALADMHIGGSSGASSAEGPHSSLSHGGQFRFFPRGSSSSSSTNSSTDDGESNLVSSGFAEEEGVDAPLPSSASQVLRGSVSSLAPLPRGVQSFRQHANLSGAPVLHSAQRQAAATGDIEVTPSTPILAQSSALASPTRSTASNSSNSSASSKKLGPPLGLHILFADDETVNRRLMAAFLKNSGCTCVCLSDGDEVEAALAATGQVRLTPQAQIQPLAAAAAAEPDELSGGDGRAGRSNFNLSGGSGREGTSGESLGHTLTAATVDSPLVARSSSSPSSSAVAPNDTAGAAPAALATSTSTHSLNRPFDVILLDIIMVRSDGAEVCERLRRVHGLRLPIIAVTGNARDPQYLLSKGFSAVIAKPYSAKTVARVISRVLAEL